MKKRDERDRVKEKERERERRRKKEKREKPSNHKFIPQWPQWVVLHQAKFRRWDIQPGLQCAYGAQVPRPPFPAFPCTLTGSLIGNGATRNPGWHPNWMLALQVVV